MSSTTFFLFARPGFLDGMARIMDFGGSMNTYNESITPENADANALNADWQAVGLDMLAAVEKYREQLMAANE